MEPMGCPEKKLVTLVSGKRNGGACLVQRLRKIKKIVDCSVGKTQDGIGVLKETMDPFV